MAKQYTLDDVPNILNSISWQLKRIADNLEQSNQQAMPVTKTFSAVPNLGNSKLTQMLAKLKETNP
jgi:hypothetical protein